MNESGRSFFDLAIRFELLEINFLLLDHGASHRLLFADFDQEFHIVMSLLK